MPGIERPADAVVKLVAACVRGSAAVVVAHNRVLGRWLRGACSDPHAEIQQALAVGERGAGIPTVTPVECRVCRRDELTTINQP